jgi:hypothetical protein
MRAPVQSAAEAIPALAELAASSLAAARRRGQISHALFVRPADVVAARPASNAHRDRGERLTESVEPIGILALDSWLTLEGLQEHYRDTANIDGLRDTLTGPPQIAVWQQQTGFSEW